MVCCWARSGQFDAATFYRWGEATAEEPCRNPNVWTYDKVNSLFKFREETLCEYQKPLHLMNYLIYTYGYKGDWALDLCAGSGFLCSRMSSLQLQRHCSGEGRGEVR